jgi:hypothetical protein
MTTTAKLLKSVMTKTVLAKMAMTKLVQKQVRARHDSPPQAPARYDSPPPVLSTTETQSTSSTKKDFILRFDDIVSNQLHANSFYVFKSLTQEERAMVHRLENGYVQGFTVLKFIFQTIRTICNRNYFEIMI